MFKKQQKDILKLISGNLKITNERIDGLLKELTEIKETCKTLQNENNLRKFEMVKTNDRVSKIEHTQKDIENSITFTQDTQEEKINKIEEKIVSKVAFNAEEKNKLRQLEDRLRRNNLRLEGITESESESWNESEEKVLSIFEKQLNVSGVAIERAHRTGKIGQNRLDMLEKDINNNKCKISNIEKDLCDIKDSLNFQENDISEKISQIKKYYDKEINSLYKKSIDLENRSRRNNLRIDGLQETPGESWEDCEKAVKDIFKTLLKIPSEVVVERAPRIGQFKENKPRTLVLKLLNYQDKNKILKTVKQLKGTGLYINEDFAQETIYHRRKLWEEVKKLRSEDTLSAVDWVKVYQECNLGNTNSAYNTFTDIFLKHYNNHFPIKEKEIKNVKKKFEKFKTQFEKIFAEAIATGQSEALIPQVFKNDTLS
nr:uncharacterized protein LOC124816600 [Hydra vulgaris]